MSEFKIPEEILESSKLKGLVQVLNGDNKDFKFLNLGKLFLNYNVKVVKGDAFASRLAGCDNDYQLETTGLKSSSISIPIPKDSTHFYLGEEIWDEEMYLEHKENSYARSIIPIVFLKK